MASSLLIKPKRHRLSLAFIERTACGNPFQASDFRVSSVDRFRGSLVDWRFGIGFSLSDRREC